MAKQEIPMSDEVNPYAAPLAESESLEGSDISLAGAEEIRRRHLKHEASVRSIGTLYYISAAFWGVATIFVAVFHVGVLTLVALRAEAAGRPPMDPIGLLLMFVGLALYCVLAVVSYFLGRGLRRLNPRMRMPVGILSAIGLLAFPLGTMINGYILYLLFCEKGKIVFSPEYQEVRRQTPHMRYKTSKVVWILLALLLVLLLLGVGGFILSA